MHYFIYGYEDVDPTPSTQTDDTPKSYTQDDLNRVDKKNRVRAEAAEKELQAAKELLSQIQQQHTMTETEKAELAQKLEQLEQAKMSEQERREHEQNKLKKAFEEQVNGYAQKLAEVTRNRDELIVTRQIKDLALSGVITAADGTGEQVLAVLQHRCEVGEDGEVVVKNFEYTEDDKVFKGDLPVAEAIEKMKAMKKWANFWRDPARPGFSDAISSGGKPGEFKISDIESYIKAKAKGEIPWLKKD